MPIDPGAVTWNPGAGQAPQPAAEPGAAPVATAAPQIDASQVVWDQPAQQPASQPAPAAGAAPAAAPAPIDPSQVTWDQPQNPYLHGLGLGVRGAVHAIGSLGEAAYDAIGQPINAAMDLALGSGNGPRVPHAAEAVDSGLTDLGLPQAQTPTERVIQDVYKGAGAAMGGVGAGAAIEAAAPGPITAALGKLLQQAPMMQAVSGATSGAAQGVAQEEGAGPLTQAVAGIAGAMAPSAIPFGAAAVTRGILRGGENGAAEMQSNIGAFQDATGTTPTLGQATQRPAIQALETGLANSLGGTGIMQRAGQRQLDAMDDAVNGLASQLSGRSTATDAGNAISQGIQRFKGDFKNTQRQLYAKLDDYIAPDTPVAVDSTKQAMAALNADIAGAPALSQWFKNAKIQGLQDALESDTAGAPASVHVYAQPPVAGGGVMNAPIPRDPLQVVIPESPPTNTLPYQALQKLRTLVGSELTNNSLTSDIPRAKWSSLYSALSDDLGTAAAAAGPQAQQAWQRATNYTRAGMQRLDALDGIVSKELPETVFRTAMGANGDGGTRIQSIMKSLPLPERRQVVATTLKRLGLANPQNQDEVGDVFSSERFLTNYNKMAPEARTSLFSGTGLPGLQQKIDGLARVAAIRRDSGSAFSNPSGTARLGMLMAQSSGLGAALATGSPTKIAAALGTFAAPALAAKGVSSPGIVNWVSHPSEISAGAVPAVSAAAVRGVSAQNQSQQPVQQRANGGEVFSTYPQAAKARFNRGGDYRIVPADGGFSLVPKFADGGQVAAPAPSAQAADIDARAHQAATSPQNDLPEPTDKQIAAGNYAKGHVRIHGMDVSIENPAGSTRRGVAPDGTPWESQMAAHYGYVKKSVGNDGEHLDTFVGPNPESKTAFVIDQLTPDGKKFDEHKGALGFNSADEAKAAYMGSYSPDWKGFGAISSVPIPTFRAWAQSGKQLKEPLAYEQPEQQAS